MRHGYKYSAAIQNECMQCIKLKLSKSNNLTMDAHMIKLMKYRFRSFNGKRRVFT